MAELAGRFPHLRQRLERQMEIATWFEDTERSDSGGADEDSSRGSAASATIRFGDYDLYAEFARGGMGVIYRARHRKLKRMVALKTIRPERLLRFADVRRFKNETRIIARLDHPNIIPILDVSRVDGVRYFTMKMVSGRDLDSRCREYLGDGRRAARLSPQTAGPKRKSEKFLAALSDPALLGNKDCGGRLTRGRPRPAFCTDKPGFGAPSPLHTFRF